MGTDRVRGGAVLDRDSRPLQGDDRRVPGAWPEPARHLQPLYHAALVRRAGRLAERGGAGAVRAVLRPGGAASGRRHQPCDNLQRAQYRPRPRRRPSASGPAGDRRDAGQCGAVAGREGTGARQFDQAGGHPAPDHRAARRASAGQTSDQGGARRPAGRPDDRHLRRSGGGRAGHARRDAQAALRPVAGGRARRRLHRHPELRAGAVGGVGPPAAARGRGADAGRG